MKVIYKRPEYFLNDLYKNLPEGITAIEIINPDDIFSESTKECIRDDVLQVKLWDEEKYGDDYILPIFCGEGGSDTVEYLLRSERDYSEKLFRWIKSNEDVVIITDNVYKKDELYKYFIEQNNCRVHLVNIIDKEVRTSDYTSFIKTIEDADKIKSIAFVNIWDMFEERRVWLNTAVEETEAIKQLVKEEIVNLLRFTIKIENSDEEKLYIYNREKQSYMPYELTENDIYDPKYDVYDRLLFERIAPNKGRETCNRLKDYRQRYRKNNNIPLSNYKCKFEGPCKGVCPYCDGEASKLWDIVNNNKNWNNERLYLGGYIDEGRPRRDWEESIAEQYGKDDTITARVNGIIRLRENIDGPGIRTLVLMNDCPLACKYCINKDIVNQFPLVKLEDVHSLGCKLEKDGIYFEATGGGVTFGGGEPLLFSDFIHAFCDEYPMWNFAIETSLNVEKEQIEKIIDDVDLWYIDIKDMSPEIYKAYTGCTNTNVINNLLYLSKNVDKSKIICRVPLIDGYNTEEDIEESVKALKEMGFERIDRFKYKS